MEINDLKKDDELFIEIKRKHKTLESGYSLNASGLRFLLDEISNKKYKNIIEFGAGLSTVYIAEMIKQLHFDAIITSVESDPYWLDKVRGYAIKHGLDNFINFIYAPVFPDPRMGENNKWYDESLLKASLKEEVFDMVIVDGPIAYLPSIERSRYGAIPFMISRLSNICTIVLDDCNRKGESVVLNLWKQEFGLSFESVDDRIAACYIDHTTES